MSNKNPSQRSAERANADLDALLRKGVQADQRATKPAFPIPAHTQPATYQSPAPQTPPIPIPPLECLTVRFTQNEARLLEKARGAARAQGFKISDTAVFRLALNALTIEQITPQNIQAVLEADGRRR